jgi:hypothetical protein
MYWMLKRADSKAAGESKPEEVQTALRVDRSPLEWILANGETPLAIPIAKSLFLYVEDFDEPRTKLPAFFSIRTNRHER